MLEVKPAEDANVTGKADGDGKQSCICVCGGRLLHSKSWACMTADNIINPGRRVRNGVLLFARRRKNHLWHKKGLPNQVVLETQAFVCESCGCVQLRLSGKDLDIFKEVACDEDYKPKR